MKAVQFETYGDADVLKLVEVELPEPGPGTVRVKVAAAGVNPADYKWREGMFRDMSPVPLPHVVGYDISGTIDALGEGVEGFAKGERVFAMLDPFEKGGYAEFAIAKAEWLAKVPDGMTLDQAATLPTPALAGLQMVEQNACPEPRQTVLITGAVGSVGRFAINATNRRGARVVAGVLDSQRELALALGADEAIVVGEPLPAGMAFDHVVDTVGGDDVAALCRALRPGGKIVTAATTPINPEGLAAIPSFFAVSPNGAQLSLIASLVAEGTVEVPSPRPMPLAKAVEAHRLVETGVLTEKIVLNP